MTKKKIKCPNCNWEFFTKHEVSQLKKRLKKKKSTLHSLDDEKIATIIASMSILLTPVLAGII